jgi:hypothetical protein
LLGLSNDDVKTIGAGATTVGVLLALFAPWLRRWWRRPLLSLLYDSSGGAPHWDQVPLEKDFFLRVRVRNARGCDPAEETQVLVASYRASPLGLGLDGRALEWSGQRAKDDPPVTTIRVPPGLHRHVDLIQITATATEPIEQTPAPDEVATAEEEGGLEARVCVHPKPWGAAHIVPVGEFEIVVIITAANADAVSYQFTVSYQGELSATLLAPPRRTRRRGPAGLARAGAKWILGGFRA